MSKERIFELVRNEELLLFVGAGMSLYAGYPNGAKLAEILHETFSLLFGRSLLYLTIYLTLSTISCFILLSTFRNSFSEFYFIRMVLAGTYLALIRKALFGDADINNIYKNKSLNSSFSKYNFKKYTPKGIIVCFKSLLYLM